MLSIFIGSDHPSGPGLVKTHDCSATFDFYIPQDMNRYPFFYLVTRKSHSHHPPLPSKVPDQIVKEVREAFQEEDILTLTARMLRIF